MLPDDEALIDELSSVRLVETGSGLVRLDHRSGEHDDQAVTIAMVAASLFDRPTAHRGADRRPPDHVHRSSSRVPGRTARSHRARGKPRPADLGPIRLDRRFFERVRRTRGDTPPGPR